MRNESPPSTTLYETQKLLSVTTDDEYMEASMPPLVIVSRPALSSSQWLKRYPLVDDHHGHGDSPTIILEIMRSLCQKFSCLAYFFSLFPILNWLPKYKWRSDLMNDIVSGFTVAVMHIPQGMAYGLLAGVPPVVGIYTAFFPVLLYVFLGTMPHVSMGTFAVMSILVSKPVHKLGYIVLNATNHTPDQTKDSEVRHDPLSILGAVCFVVGFFQVTMGLVRLGSFVGVLLADTLISAFTVGASFHVFTSQVKHVLGVNLTPQIGLGRLVLTYISLGEHLPHINPVSLILSLTCFILLFIVDKYVQSRVKKHCQFSIPSQLFLVVATTALTSPLKLSRVHHVRIISDIGAIPTGLPSPILPPLKLVPQVFVDSIPAAIIGYVIGQGLGTMFATKHGYKVDPNQELIAQGACNLLGSMFQCLPIAGSLSRSLVQEASGCRTMITSLVSACLLLLVLLWLAPLFSPLPVCVLASIIVASLTGILARVTDIRRFWDRSRWDGMVWLVTFLATVLLDVDLGLAVGVVVSVMSILLRGCVPRVIQLQEDQQHEVWLDCSHHRTVPSHITVLSIVGPIHFLSAGYLRFLVSRLLRKPCLIHNVATDDTETRSIAYENDVQEVDLKIRQSSNQHSVVLDLSRVSFIDDVAAKTLLKIETKVKDLGSRLAVAGPSQEVMEVLEYNGVVDLLQMGVYPTYLDALQLIKHNYTWS